MVVCKYFLAGQCYYGDQCRNEHVDSSSSSRGGANRRANFYDSSYQNRKPPTNNCGGGGRPRNESVVDHRGQNVDYGGDRRGSYQEPQSRQQQQHLVVNLDPRGGNRRNVTNTTSYESNYQSSDSYGSRRGSSSDSNFGGGGVGSRRNSQEQFHQSRGGGSSSGGFPSDERHRQSRDSYRPPSPVNAIRLVSPERRSTGGDSGFDAVDYSATARYRWVSPALLAKEQPPAQIRQQPEQRRSSEDRRSVMKKDTTTASEVQPDSAAIRRRVETSTIQEPETLLKRIQEHIQEWRESAQWPFSCYGLSNFECLKLFQDWSPEEMRWRAYRARAENKMDAHENDLKNLKNEVRKMWTRLLKLSLDDRETLLVYLRPYIADTPSSLAVRSITGVKPEFSFKRPPSQQATTPPQTASKFSFKSASQISPSNQNTENRPSPPPAGAFSFRNAATSAGILKPINNNGVQQGESILHTEKKLLTVEEVKAFEARDFLSIHDIPTRPPPKELC